TRKNEFFENFFIFLHKNSPEGIINGSSIIDPEKKLIDFSNDCDWRTITIEQYLLENFYKNEINKCFEHMVCNGNCILWNRNGYKPRIEVLIDCGLDLNYKMQKINTTVLSKLIEKTCEYGEQQLFLDLIKKNKDLINVDELDSLGNTALHF